VSTGNAGSEAGTSGSFVRQSSGLIREFGISDVVLINIVGVNLGIVASLSIASVAGIWPGASMIILAVIGALVSLATVGVYGMFSAAMPRAGGDYVFVGRSLTPWLGFLANWMITLSLFVVLGIFAVGLYTQALAPSLAAFGLTVDAPGLVEAAETISTDKTLQAFLAIATVLAGAAIAIAGDRAVKWTFRILGTIGIGGMAVIVLTLLFTSSEGWANNMNEALANYNGGTVEGINAAAHEAGFSDVGFSLSASLSAIPFAFYLYVGLTYTSYLGGEIQRPQRSQPLGMGLALLISLTFMVLFFAGVYKTMGWENVHSWAYLAGENPEALKFFGESPIGAFLIGAGSGSPIIAAIGVVNFVAWTFMIIVFASIMPIRNLFAWSMDGLIPQAVSKVSKRGTPYVATVIVAVFAIGMVILTLYSTFVQLIVNYTLMYSVTFLLAGIAAIAFPYTRPDIFEKAPAVVRKRIAGLPLISIAGAVEAIVFTAIIIEALKTPAFGGPAGRTALLVIGGLIVAAPVYYAISRSIRKRQGYDVDAAFRTLPPD
jgi:basic amino acid/polyamine antiporter, APA family